VLLLHGWDPVRPADPFWFTLGGAADPGETLAQAAVRELREEAGIVADLAAVGEPFETSQIEFTWSGVLFVQDQTFFAMAVDAVDVSFDGQEPLERATIDKHGWLYPEELENGAERPADPEIPRLMRLAVDVVRGTR
jgi:8-oxo-dGTP pyrophosphatase MutT (NUDIX family)